MNSICFDLAICMGNHLNVRDILVFVLHNFVNKNSNRRMRMPEVLGLGLVTRILYKVLLYGIIIREYYMVL